MADNREYREFSFNELTVDGTRGVDVHSTAPGSTLASHDRQQILHGLIDTNVDVTRAFYNHSKILVVALNGPVIGLSTSLVSLVDFVYAAPHAFLLTPFSSLGLVAEGGASRSLVERLGMSKANEALLMSKRISCEELLQVGFVSKVLKPESGKIDDSAGFLKKVIQEVMESLGSHLNHRSVLKIKELIRRPEREVLDRHVLTETYLGLERFMEGAPQQEFRKLSAGQKKHKL